MTEPTRADRLRAEADMWDAEEAFRKKKAAGKVTAEDKLALRSQRQEFRETHRVAKPGAAPDAIKTSAKVKETG